MCTEYNIHTMHKIPVGVALINRTRKVLFLRASKIVHHLVNKFLKSCEDYPEKPYAQVTVG